MIAKAAKAASDAPDHPEFAYSQWDWQIIRSIADKVGERLADNESENKLLTVSDATGARGGNWDVSTRFATACESMVLPYRLEYRFDVDAASGTVVARITLPLPDQMPRSQWIEREGRWVDLAAQQPAAAAAYSLRLAALVASAAFGASVGITRVVIHGHEDSLNNSVVLSLEFDRMSFVMGTAPAIKGGAAGAPGTEYDPATLFSMLRPARFSLAPDANGHNQPVEKLAVNLPNRRIPLPEDTRELPPDMAALLHAHEVRELDVISEQDAAMTERFRGAQADRDDAPLLAVAQLEDIVEKASQLTEDNLSAMREAHPECAEAIKPLYCEGVFSRYLVDLDDDAPDLFARASDIAQSARSTLSSLYMDMGDNAGALAQAEKCVELAPTSPSAYQDLITAYVQMDRYDLVVDVAKRALRYAVLDDGIFYLYYRLAYAFWKTGRLEEGAACYARVPRLSSMGESAARELTDLLEEMGGRKPMSSSEAAATLRAAGVPIAPTDEAVAIVAKAAVGLTDAGIPLAAAPMATLVGRIQRSDAISAAAASLKEGA